MPQCTEPVASEDYADFIYRHSSIPLDELQRLFNTPCIDLVNQDYAVIYVPLEPLLPITVENYTYTAIPKLYALLDTSSMEASGILNTFNQPALNVRGEGIIIGMIDTGVEYQNPLFRNADGSTRIFGIWDQTLESDPSSSFLYGREFTEEQINEALKSDHPLEIVPSTDTNGHGTFLTGIAAGGTAPNNDFVGAAPDCNIGVVKLKPAKQYLRDFYHIKNDAIAYQENDIMMGIRYLLQLAARYQMPLAICLGLGTNLGSHDGTAPLGRLFRSLSSYLGVVSVIAAGNESGLRHHFFGTIQESDEYEDVEIRVAPDDNGFTLELWGNDSELFSVGFISPTGEIIPRIPIIIGKENRIPFVLEQTVITINYVMSEIGSGSQLIFMRFEFPTTGIWRIRVYSSPYNLTGQFHMWLPVQGFISESTGFLLPNPDTTITDPGNAKNPITVSTYNHVNNGIYIHSSRGYTRLGDIKPDIAAPGVNVYGPAISPSGGRRPLAEASESKVPMTRMTGSSVAAAHATGAAADLMSWGMKQGNYFALSDSTIKAYLIRGARRNPDFTYPNREWGYGALDLYQTFLRIRE